MTIKQKMVGLAGVSFIGLGIIFFATMFAFSSIQSSYNELVKIEKIQQKLAKTAEGGLQIAAALRGAVLDSQDTQAVENTKKSIADIDKLIKTLGSKDVADASNGFSKFHIEENYRQLADVLSRVDTKLSNNEALTMEDNKEVNKAWRPLKKELSSWIDANKIQQKEYEEKFKNDISSAIQTSIIISVVVIIIFIVFTMMISKGIIASLSAFEKGLLSFFDFLNHKTEKSQMINIDSKDELNAMALIINENIKNAEAGLLSDAKSVDEAVSVLENVKNGRFNNKVSSIPSNKELAKLVVTLNEMLSVMQIKIGNDLGSISKTIQDFSKYNFASKITNPKGDIEKAINGLGDEVSTLLASSLKVGQVLQNVSNSLISNVNVLNTSSNHTAASLEETAAALEEITATITANTQTITQMSSHSNEVTNSAKSGQELAKNTAIAMDEITEQVNSINEAIAIIDQIAFQTNILSLNAAVEAATAGEAGKGFAVVAGEVRNLANRSAEAAKEIKNIVELATQKSMQGKEISTKMIDGYGKLLENISQTTSMIAEINYASKEQEASINQINDSVSRLDSQTQQNASIATQTQEIALQTGKISNEIIQETMKKEFIGKH